MSLTAAKPPRRSFFGAGARCEYLQAWRGAAADARGAARVYGAYAGGRCGPKFANLAADNQPGQQISASKRLIKTDPHTVRRSWATLARALPPAARDAWLPFITPKRSSINPNPECPCCEPNTKHGASRAWHCVKGSVPLAYCILFSGPARVWARQARVGSEINSTSSVPIGQ